MSPLSGNETTVQKEKMRCSGSLLELSDFSLILEALIGAACPGCASIDHLGNYHLNSRRDSENGLVQSQKPQVQLPTRPGYPLRARRRILCHSEKLMRQVKRRLSTRGRLNVHMCGHSAHSLFRTFASSMEREFWNDIGSLSAKATVALLRTGHAQFAICGWECFAHSSS